MSENRLPDYLDHIQQAYIHSCHSQIYINSVLSFFPSTIICIA
jgi:hypothetical protein